LSELEVLIATESHHCCASASLCTLPDEKNRV
jgi:hypothetical protein